MYNIYMNEKEIEKLNCSNIQIVETDKIEQYIKYYGVNNMLNLVISLRRFKLFYTLNTSELISIYNFDKNFRTLLFHYIIDIELNLRNQIANLFNIKYGSTNYLKKENFDISNKYVDENLKSIVKDYNSYKNNVELNINEVAPDILFRYVTFGGLSKLYFSLKQIDRQIVAKNFSVDDKKFKQMLKNLVNLRNKCAHGNSVIDYSSNFEINNDYNLKYVNIFLLIKSILKLTKLDKNEFKSELKKQILILKKEINENDFKSFINYLNISYFSIEL